MIYGTRSQSPVMKLSLTYRKNPSSETGVKRERTYDHSEREKERREMREINSIWEVG